MKSAFSATLIFQIVIFFVVLFTGYICISINQAKAFNMKNEIVKAIEKYAPDLENPRFIAHINEALSKEGYRLEGSCSSGYIPYKKTNGISAGNSGNGEFCVKIVDIGAHAGIRRRYYKVETFYQLQIPIIQSLFRLKTTGETKVIYGG